MEGPSGSVSRKLDLIAGCGRRYPVSPRLGVVGDELCRARLFAGVLARPLSRIPPLADAVYRAAKLWTERVD